MDSKLSEDLQSRIVEAKDLLSKGINPKKVSKQTGLSYFLTYQVKKSMTVSYNDFGCVVCSDKKVCSSLFCEKHRHRYVKARNLKK